MRPSFNTAGPCFPGEHYMLPPERRLGRVMELIDEHKFFTLTAGRQTGKTTCLQWLARHLDASGAWRALMVDLQTAREEPDPSKAFRTVLGKLEWVCRRTYPEITCPDIDDSLRDPKSAVGRYL